MWLRGGGCGEVSRLRWTLCLIDLLALLGSLLDLDAWISVGLGIQHCVGRARIFVGLDASHLAVSAGVGSLLDLLSNIVLGGVGFSVDLMILHWLCSEMSDLRWTLCYVH